MPSVADIIVEEKFSTGGGVRQLTLDADGQPLALLRGMQASYRSYSRNRSLRIHVADRAEWMTTSRDSRLMAISETDCVQLFQTNGCALLWEAKVRGLCRFEFSPNAEFLAVLDADNLRLFRTTYRRGSLAGSPSRLVPAGEWRRLV